LKINDDDVLKFVYKKHLENHSAEDELFLIGLEENEAFGILVKVFKVIFL
jgi:hypothetical protein